MAYWKALFEMNNKIHRYNAEIKLFKEQLKHEQRWAHRNILRANIENNKTRIWLIRLSMKEFDL